MYPGFSQVKYMASIKKIKNQEQSQKAVQIASEVSMCCMFLSWDLQRCGHTLMLLLQRLGRSTKTLKYIFTSCTGFSVWVVCVCVCEAPSQNTLKTNFVFLFAVEEILVCSDGSQPEILQGLHRRGGEFPASLFYISRWDSRAVLISSLASVFTQASDLDGEIDLSTCCNVTEYQAQRNYGFQIHVRPWLLLFLIL